MVHGLSDRCLAAIRAAAAEVKSMLLYLFARLRVDQDLADAYPATIAAAGMPDLVVVWCASEGIAAWRYPYVRHGKYLLWPGLGRWASPRGHSYLLPYFSILLVLCK